MFIVYKTTNLVNGRYYVGIHKVQPIYDYYLGSGVILQQAIEKYGKENFVRETLFEFETLQECLAKECEIVNDEFLNRPETYNVTKGGGRPPYLVGDAHPLYGKKRPDSTERFNNQNPAKLNHVRERMKSTTIVLFPDGVSRRVDKTSLEAKIYSHPNKGRKLK